MVLSIIEKIILAIVGMATTGLCTLAVSKYHKYKKLVKQEEDKALKEIVSSVLDEALNPIKEDIKNLQKVDYNFTTSLEPVQEEIEHLKDDISKILRSLKNQGVDLKKVKEDEENLEELTRCAWRYRIRLLCHVYLKRGYITTEEFNQLQEMYNLYVALGGNGQTKELYEKTIQLPIRDE